MKITDSVLQALRTTSVKIFADTYKNKKWDYNLLATLVPSSSSSNTYGWFGGLPELREWVGDRVVKDVKEHSYTIQNKSYEQTIGLSRNDIEDDNMGTFSLLIKAQAESVSKFTFQQVAELLNKGKVNLCYDKKPFFGDHIIKTNADGTGSDITVSNLLSGTDAKDKSAGWYLLDTSQQVKPLIVQERDKAKLESLTDAKSSAVFKSNKFQFGARWRGNFGYGFWQMALKHEGLLNAENFEKALETMETMKKDGLEIMGVTPTILVVPPSLRSQAEALIKAELVNGGETNTNYKRVEIMVVPFLTNNP